MNDREFWKQMHEQAPDRKFWLISREWLSGVTFEVVCGASKKLNVTSLHLVDGLASRVLHAEEAATGRRAVARKIRTMVGDELITFTYTFRFRGYCDAQLIGRRDGNPSAKACGRPAAREVIPLFSDGSSSVYAVCKKHAREYARTLPLGKLEE